MQFFIPLQFPDSLAKLTPPSKIKIFWPSPKFLTSPPKIWRGQIPPGYILSYFQRPLHHDLRDHQHHPVNKTFVMRNIFYLFSKIPAHPVVNNIKLDGKNRCKVEVTVIIFSFFVLL